MTGEFPAQKDSNAKNVSILMASSCGASWRQFKGCIPIRKSGKELSTDKLEIPLDVSNDMNRSINTPIYKYCNRIPVLHI